MANFEIPESPEYIEQVRKFETTDKAHADLFNTAFQVLLNNEAFLKKVLEKQEIDTQEQFQQHYEQLTSYTDIKIGELINGAPETLDTIKEVADAILENETVVEALNDAVGKKLNKDGDLTDTTVTFTTGDEEEPTGWKKLGKLVSGKLKDILNHVSVMSNNLKFLYKLCGTTDISSLGDGTITGALSVLNTGIQDEKNAKAWKTSTVSFADCTGIFFDTAVEDFLDKVVVPEIGKITEIGSTFKNILGATNGATFCALTTVYSSRDYYGGIVISYSQQGGILFSYQAGEYGIKRL